MERKQGEFTTRAGVRVRVQAVNWFNVRRIEAAVEQEFRERGEPVDPPTYAVEVAGGGTETHAHDETTLQTDEDREAWRAHQEARRRMLSEQTVRYSRYVTLHGIVFDEEALAVWVADQEYWGLPVPEDERALREAYLGDLLADPEDAEAAMVAITVRSLAGRVTDEEAAAAEALFRRAMARAATERPAGRRRGVDALGADERGAGGEGVGDDAEPVSGAGGRGRGGDDGAGAGDEPHAGVGDAADAQADADGGEGARGTEVG